MTTAIVGVGTIIFQDEGVGVYAQKYIEKNYTFQSDVTLVDGGVLGFKLMSYFQEYDRVLILDTLTIDDAVGAIYNLPAQELLGLGSYKQTAHEVEVVEMLEICLLLETMAQVSIMGIVPQDIQSVNVGLSEEIKGVFPAFVEATMQELEKSGVKFSKNAQEFSLDRVIESYNNPQSACREYHNGN
ncbi:MAG: HyaD/HybD family hydrogenase maturation endopeptidase [Campylobacterales bacterium]|nr:HyaD/HybD family hydrogenase maturation endopeptidase [Campylobacterales bacterium]